MSTPSVKYPAYHETVGNTPIVKLPNLCPLPHITLLAKLEFYNPTFSIKDRMISYIFHKALDEGAITPTTVLVEASSGNTASSVALFAAIHQLNLIVTMPDTTCPGKIKLAEAYGAEVILCPADAAPDSPEYYTNKAYSIAKSLDNSFTFDQYNNLCNIEAHYMTTGAEIITQTKGNIDIIVGCASTGGTISGIGKRIKESHPEVEMIIADSDNSVFKNFHDNGIVEPIKKSPKLIEGAGKKYIPDCMQMQYIDQVISMQEEAALSLQPTIAHKEGLLVGGSGALALAAALKIAHETPQDTPKTILTIIADTGLKYLSKTD